MTTSAAVLCLLATSTITAVSAVNQRCYVCIPNAGSSIADVAQIFPAGESLPLCNGFREGEMEYIRECPSSKYVGCLTQTNGTHITKTCSMIEVQDCKTANRIEYCYCKGELCNGESVPVEEMRPPVPMPGGTGDDDEDAESYAEGSGSSEEGSREKPRPFADEAVVEGPDSTVTASPTAAGTTKAVASSAPLLSVSFSLSTFLPYFTLRTMRGPVHDQW